MEFAPFIYEYVANNDYYNLEDILNYDNPKDYLGFDLPFKFEDTPKCWKKLENICKNYIDEHKIEIVQKNIIDTDLEKGSEEIEAVFSFDGKYYLFGYYSSWCESICDYPDDAIEVFPHTKTITEYY